MKSRAHERRGRRGNCYVTCEALYHLLGGKDAGLTPHTVCHEGDVHWYLVRRRDYWLGEKVGTFEHRDILDPTAAQFREPPPYERGTARGFLTKKPSKRARALMEQMLWQGIPAGRRRVTPR